MRAGVIGIFMGIFVALSLKSGNRLSSNVVGASLVTEILFIVIFGLIEVTK